jgi:hypothetical protein
MALRLQPQSIRAELALIVVVLALPLVALIAYGTYRDGGRERSHAEGTVGRMAESTAGIAARFVEDARLVLEPIARRPLVRAMDPERCDPGLKDLLELHPRARDFLVVDRTGRIICGAIPPPRDRVVRVQDEGLLRQIIETGAGTASGPRASWAGARPSRSPSRKRRSPMQRARLLLAEDSAQDIELTLNALAEHNLSNSVTVARDGAEALDYLCKRGKLSRRENGNPALLLLANAYVVKSVEFDKFLSAVRDLGLFRMLVNAPPLAAARA